MSPTHGPAGTLEKVVSAVPDNVFIGTFLIKVLVGIPEFPIFTNTSLKVTVGSIELFERIDAADNWPEALESGIKSLNVIGPAILFALIESSTAKGFWLLF